MKIITESEVINNGLNFVRNYDLFEITGNHYYPYPSSLKALEKEYHVETKYFGNSDHGSTKTIFKRKTQQEIIKDEQDKDLNYQISKLEKKFNVKITYNEN